MNTKGLHLCRGFLLIFTISATVSANSKERKRALKQQEINLTIEAGCTELGTLLVKGACLVEEYQNNQAPEPEETAIYNVITHTKVLDVDEKKKTVTIDVKQSILWEDHRIKTNFSDVDKKKGGIRLPLRKVPNQIWIPQLRVIDILTMKRSMEGVPFTEMRLLSNNPFRPNTTLVRCKLERWITVFCPMHHTHFPMDKHHCQFRMASRDSESLMLLLYDPEHTHHTIKKYDTAGFDMTIIFQGRNCTHDHGIDTFGFDIYMQRTLQPYLFQYYFPCIAIVIVSQISFIIPLSAIPGRVALVVTQFLTLTNIFIHQMVGFFTPYSASYS